jgi:uncharacterized protein (DUF2252 family)
MGTAATVIHLTVSERADRGRSARAETPRASHASLAVQQDRDPIAWLQAQAPTRVAELLPIRYGRMARSPLAFFRGAATVMANDLARTPRTSLEVQLCGDAHLLNFGGYASPERDLVFDLNDFDETLPGPFEWDVKRLAASVEIAGRARQFADGDRHVAVLGAVRGYRETMRQLAASRNLDVWYARVDADDLVAELRSQEMHVDAKTMERAAAARARSDDDARALAKLTHLVDGIPRIVSKPPLIVPIGELDDQRSGGETELRETFRRYRRSLQPDRRRLLEGFRFGDLARKVVGVGSVGTRCWILLLLGRDTEDLLFLQLKEAQISVLEPHLGRSVFTSHAERVVEGQRLSQASSDIFLGWTRAADIDGGPRDFYVRQLRDWKMSVDLGRISARGLATYARWCGSTLARAHARSGDRVAIAAYLGTSDEFDRALAHFAVASADLNEHDHAALARSIREGRVTAAGGP